MRRLRGSNGLCLDSERAMVDRLVRDVFGVPDVDPPPWVGEGLEEVRGCFVPLDARRMGRLLDRTESAIG